jgi:hypothetical protein
MSLGEDMWYDEDLSPDLIEADDVLAIVQAAKRRLSTRKPPGLWYAPAYGIDLGDYIRDIASTEQIQLAIQRELEADERVTTADVTLTRQGASIGGTVSLYTTSGARYTLTLRFDETTGAVLLESL